MEGNGGSAKGIDFDGLRKKVERLSRPECPACGNAPEWLVADTVIELPFAAKGGAISTIPYVCDGCGFVRLHSIPVLNGQD